MAFRILMTVTTTFVADTITPVRAYAAVLDHRHSAHQGALSYAIGAMD
jgi:hypothetical protein